MTLKRPDPFQEILFRMNVRFLSVQPLGILIAPNRPVAQHIDVRILNHGGARTLYRNRNPICRSLDGIKSVTDTDTRCHTCHNYEDCTPQVRIDLIFESRPHRLLLAFTSANNFLLYNTKLVDKNLKLQDVGTSIKVINRGSWGELRFSEIKSHLPLSRISRIDKDG